MQDPYFELTDGHNHSERAGQARFEENLPGTENLGFNGDQFPADFTCNTKLQLQWSLISEKECLSLQI